MIKVTSNLINEWRTAALCSNSGCVEVGTGDAVVGVRDSKQGDASPVLEFSATAWRSFIGSLKSA